MDEYVVLKYIRLSTDDSYNDSMSIENQRLMLDRYIADMDAPNIKALEFVDNGYSGTNFERPGVQELLDLVRSGKADCVIVKDFSRFGRNAIEVGYFLERVFPLYHTRFIGVMDAYDSDKYEGGTGGIEVTLKFLVHEHYSRDLSRKIKAAKHEKARRGEFVTKNCAFGYVKSKDNRLEIDPDAADTVRLIYSLSSEGKNLSAIAQELYNQKRPTPSVYKKRKQGTGKEAVADYIWGKSVLLKMMRDEQYIGTYVAGKTAALEVGSRTVKKVPESEWIRIPRHHPAIVSSELFEKVNAAIGVKKEPVRKREISTDERYAAVRQSPLRGKVVCGSCGHVMTLSMTKNTAFQCLFTRSAPGASCHKFHIHKNDLENILFEIISKQVQFVPSADCLSEITAVTSADLRESECGQMIEQKQDSKCGLYEQYVLGEITAGEYMSRKIEIENELDRLNRVCASLTEQRLSNQNIAEANAKLCEVAPRENVLTKPLVDALIEKVRVYPDERLEIVWKTVAMQQMG